jgi:N-acetylmuramoyl-L-alanine amidase
VASETKPHVVGPGDYLTAIAYAAGVTVDDIWNDPANAQLKELRSNPEMLAPGDVVYVPVVERKFEPVSVGEAAQMMADPTKVKVNVVLEMRDDDGQNVLAGKTFRIEGLGGDRVENPIGPDGAVSFEVPATTREVVLVVDEMSLKLPVLVGGMDPVNEASGLHQRLRHLGYTDGDAGEYDLGDAIRAFQQDQNIEASGDSDAATLQALVDKHCS